MRVDQQSTARERDVFAVSQDCLKYYHPDDTDYAAAVVRSRYCTCFAAKWVDRVANDKQLGEALSHDSSGGQAGVKAAEQVVFHCSKRLGDKD
jgi:hypothetical protein